MKREISEWLEHLSRKPEETRKCLVELENLAAGIASTIGNSSKLELLLINLLHDAKLSSANVDKLKAQLKEVLVEANQNRVENHKNEVLLSEVRTLINRGIQS